MHCLQHSQQVMTAICVMPGQADISVCCLQHSQQLSDRDSMAELRRQVEELQRGRAMMEAEQLVLRAENESLAADKAVIQSENGLLRDRIWALESAAHIPFFEPVIQDADQDPVNVVGYCSLTPAWKRGGEGGGTTPQGLLRDCMWALKSSAHIPFFKPVIQDADQDPVNVVRCCSLMHA